MDGLISRTKDPAGIRVSERYGSHSMKPELRMAVEADIPVLEELIPLSVRTLQAPHYSPAQMQAALGLVFGVDRQLIADETYYVIVADGGVAACGGWSKRRALFGSDSHRAADESLLQPGEDPARIRAFFVHPNYTRRGFGRALLGMCEAAARAEHFVGAELVATLSGEPLYAACGYSPVERFEIPLRDGLTLPAIRMFKDLRS